MLRNLFTRKALPLTGAPTVRRLKSYSAQSGYVYQYFWEGQRPVTGGTEYVFDVSADRKTSHPVSVVLEDAALRAWEQANKRTLAPNERYGIAKMALFLAFDERETPALLKQPVSVRASDVATIIEQLGL
jgi:hypothetical protein